MIIDFIADYYKNVEKYPVRSQVEPGYLQKVLPESAPNNPESMETILQDVQQHIVPGITHCGSIAGFLGEMLSSGFNIVGFNWISSPAATELENIVMDWLGQMIKLPKSFLFSGNGGGVIQGTTCEAILCTLTAARDRVLNKIGRENISKLVVYGSDQTHSGLIPLFLCATIGTTAITAVDPLKPLCDVAKQFGIWVHVDAAYAGSACIFPEFRHFIDGVEGADSFSLNAHKWFFATLDCCCLWATNPEYLKNKATESKPVVDYKDWQITLSRSFRSLKLWFVIRNYGMENLRHFLRSHVNMARLFERLVSGDKRFEVVFPCHFAVVCFRVSPLPVLMDKLKTKYENCLLSEEEQINEFNRELLESINASGKAYMTNVVLGGIYAIRFATGATLTEERHVVVAWTVVLITIKIKLKIFLSLVL
ncbi:Tyrosine decarboxylase 2 [Citrus sinensis]|uniref:Tyrosine decarboxylase 2 n=1 Tax=Citrus sinensis TaxID=2711 RepID=A0ACB8LC07_CITSI|nr:Tyrosine decarboxylase 2 [Citrus sinensis]